jgi:hypothetical protein
MIVSVLPSSRQFKRYVATMDDGRQFHFGLAGASTYIDNGDKKKREAYRKRHYANVVEKQLIDNLVPSSSLFAYKLLWGDSTDINKNIRSLNNLWRKKHTS